jgi:hypothetical protein
MSLRPFIVFLLLPCLFPFTASSARAQDAECFPQAEIEAREAAIRRMVSEQSWAPARDAIAALTAACPWHHGVTCEQAIVTIRLGAASGDPVTIPDGAVATEREADCASGLGLAHAAAVAHADGAHATRHAEFAASWLHHARSLRPWRPEERRAFAALPQAARRLVESVQASRPVPITRVVGEQPSIEALASALSLALWRRAPGRLQHCGTSLNILEGLGGDADDVTALSCGLAFESYTVYTTYLVERTAGGYRLVASAAEPDEGRCTADLDERLAFTRLTPAVHGFDGYLLVRRYGGAGDDERFEERRVSTVAMVCARASGECRHREIGRVTCVASDAGAVQPWHCAENWEGVPSVRRGRLTLTPAASTEIGTPSTAIPRAFRGPVALGRSFGTRSPPLAFTAQRDALACRAAGDRCR